MLTAVTAAIIATDASLWVSGVSGVSERHRERRGGSRVDRQEQGPAEEERRHTAERLTHVDVAASRVGEHGPELAERKRAQQGEHAPDDPDHQSHADVST
jgi:hypothetical protein